MWLIAVILIIFLLYTLYKKKKKNDEKSSWYLIVFYGEEFRYAMKSDSVIKILGTIMHFYHDRLTPVPPWNLFLKFDQAKELIHIKPEFFIKEKFISNEFRHKLSEVEANWNRRSEREPICYDVKNEKVIRLNSELVEAAYSPNRYEATQKAIENMLRNENKEELTFSRVLYNVFENQ